MPKSIWQCSIPGHIDGAAMGSWGAPRSDRGGMATPPERLDEVDVRLLTAVMLPDSACPQA